MKQLCFINGAIFNSSGIATFLIEALDLGPLIPRRLLYHETSAIRAFFLNRQVPRYKITLWISFTAIELASTFGLAYYDGRIAFRRVALPLPLSTRYFCTLEVGQARNLPYLPIFMTILLPHFRRPHRIPHPQPLSFLFLCRHVPNTPQKVHGSPLLSFANPSFLLLLNVFLHINGKLIIHYIGEVFHHQIIDYKAQLCRYKSFSILSTYP